MSLKIKFDMELIQIMSLFQAITRTDVKDCFDQGEKLVFIVPAAQIGKAIGKASVNVKKLELKLKKKIRIIAYSEIPEQFIKNIVYPLRLTEIDTDPETKIMTLTAFDSKTRGYLIGRAASNLRNYEMIIKRHFDIKELKVN